MFPVYGGMQKHIAQVINSKYKCNVTYLGTIFTCQIAKN